jgi:hypothetical protein
MTEFLAGGALVLSIIAIIGVLSLAREIGVLRSAGAGAEARELAVIGARVRPVQAESLSGLLLSCPPSDRTSRYLFVLPGCAPCDAMLTELGTRDWRVIDPEFYLVVRGDRDHARAIAERGGVSADHVLLDSEGTIGANFAVTGYPSGVALDGRVITGARMVSSLSDFATLGIGDGDMAAPHRPRHDHETGLTSSGGPE